MKKKIAVLLTGTTVLAMALAGCQASKGLETDNMTITQYKDVEVDEVEKAPEVSDKDVESYIESVRQSKAEVKEIKDRAVKEGDTANIDFVGKMDGKVFDGGSAKDYDLEIGSGAFIDGFEDSIVGHKVGESFDWNGQFSKDYGSAEMAGKDVVFTITVNSIIEENLPELNDKFIKTVSEKSKTVEEYKKEVAELLKKDAAASYDYSLETVAWEKVMENTKVEKYPEKELKEMKEKLIAQYKSAAEYYGMEYETMLEEQMGMTVEAFEEQIDTAVKEAVKERMVAEAIAKKEKVNLDDKSYDKEVEKIAKDYDYDSVESLKKAVTEEELKEEALKNLVKRWVADRCIQVKAQ